MWYGVPKPVTNGWSTAYNLYRVGPGSTPLLSASATATIMPDGTLVLSQTSGRSTVDLNAATPTAAPFTLPFSPAMVVAAADGSVVASDGFGALALRRAGASAVEKIGCGAVRALALSPSNIGALAFTSSQSIIVADVANRTIQKTIPFLADKLALSDDGTVLAALGDKVLQVYTLPSGALLHSIPVKNGMQSKVAFELRGDGQSLELLIVTGSATGETRRIDVTDIAGANPDFSFAMTGEEWMFSPDGTALAILKSERKWDSTGTTSTTSYATSIYEDGSLFGATAGDPLAWLDDDRLLVRVYTIESSSWGTRKIDKGAVIVDRQGNELARPALPELGATAKALEAGTRIYTPYLNKIFDTTTGAEVWARQDLLYNSSKAAANDSYVLYSSLSSVYLLAH